MTILEKIYKRLPLLLRLGISNRITNPYGPVEDMHEVIFIHIPKAAGNSVTQSLFGKSSHGHFTWKAYARYKKKFSSYYKFTIVRNPYSRFVSAFYYLRDGGMSVSDKEFSYKYLSGFTDVNDFLDRLSKDENYRDRVLSWTHFKPQVEYIFRNRIPMVDDIYKVEHLGDAIAMIAGKLGMPVPEVKVVNKGASNSDEYWHVLSDNSLKIIRELYHDDFQVLNYDV